VRGNDVKFEYGRPVGSRYGIISLSSYELFVWLCGQWCGGDSALLAPELAGQTPLPGSTEGKLSFSPYFSEVSLSDPLVLPMNSKSVVARFPPTLLIADSRDFTVSSVCHTDLELTKAGVKAELHIWDGMWHSFFNDPNLPESMEMYSIVVSFFDRHLR
jgi:epsilon-lactone hydrolase